MGTATKKVRIRHPAIAAGTGRGRAARGRGTTSTFIELKPETEEESHSTWDLNFLEDADWSVAMEETAAISKEIQEKISQLIIDKMVAGAGTMTAAAQAGQIDFVKVVNARALMLSKNIRPDCLVTGPDNVARLIQDTNFRNGFMYGDLMNKREGYMGRFLGLEIYESTQMPDNTALMLKKDGYMLYGVRRDMMLDSFEEFNEGKTEYGVCVTSRFDLKVGYADFCHKLVNSG